MLQEITSQYNANKIEKNIHRFWEENNAYKRVRESREGASKFFFVDGPPYTTGHIHLGTAWNKVIKDSILRYFSMNNYDIHERAGWDMHGLPIEVKVEGILGFQSKKDIETYGVGNFINKCKNFAIEQKDNMTEQFKSLGVWLDWENPYMTLRDEYIEAAWWTLKQAYDKDLLEEGQRVVNWCPRCETAIADSEVDYFEITDPSIYIKFRLKEEENTYVVIWTTTPWTIPSNMAVAVHPSFEYSKVKATNPEGNDEVLILASDLVEDVLKQGRYTDYEVLEKMSGKDLEGLSYHHPLADAVSKQAEFEHNIYTADYVTAEKTGCVHIAPGHGMEDFEVGVENGIPVFCPVGADGKYLDEAGKYSGEHIRDANQTIINDLKHRGVLLAEESINHRYGHCWRCKTPNIYLATVQWFLKISDIKQNMLSEIQKVDWYPEWAGTSRFKDWVEGARDWCISRQRYWGIPIPVWKCSGCGSIDVVGTKQELINKSNADKHIELHRPYVDDLTMECDCGGSMSRVEDVFDVWFDSAVASWATLGYPQSEKDFHRWWPADFITEGHDQTRGWFYSQLGASMVAFEQSPYKSVMMHGFTLDKYGKKMSKSQGNVVDPLEVVDKYGADTLRAYVLSTSAPWDDLKFNWEGVNQVYSNLNILWNVYRFPIPYMVLDNFDPKQVSMDSISKHLRKEDKWILSRMQSVIKDVDYAMSDYQLHKAIRAINEFVLEDLSRWYIQLIRPRTWVESEDPDKLAAYRVLYDVFVTLSKLIAPFTPHIAEEMYQNLVRNVDQYAPITVHMNDWPLPEEEKVDKELESHMQIARSIVESSANARQKVKRKLRWPVSRIVVAPDDKEASNAVDNLRSVLMDQTNAKDIELLDPDEEWSELGLEAIPDPSAIGPVFKKNAGEVINAIKSSNPSELKESIDNYGKFSVSLSDSSAATVTSDMVNFQRTLPDTVASAEFEGGIVYVDATLTSEIESEGFAREVIRRVQDMRKELDLSVEENIKSLIKIDDERVAELVKNMETYISKEVRADTLVIGTDISTDGEYVKDWNVEGIPMEIAISPLESGTGNV
ncbi:isoleucyl-tRNA synthetase [Methanohalobium evestigatum Z-7303]|uniref:Isoleucine--tRNA ligase n=1 Tax=Methanohalobium evestigatum (strain ATCC BAA-1072 / DSM 3721 / NBRC 107634 / OCM 161 / Z-7303) TaxID=644295 RepID=D7EA68_METEZ|nr:isoleucine--tRNA ligase [Methanohalobium evestigatum]ADI74739.1 isoleucyl-tRNA synthetase [Methanohalobium evestigatum Z-7303]